MTPPRPHQPETGRRAEHHGDDATAIVAEVGDEAPEQFELLASEYTVALLGALATGPKRGRDLIDACDAARSTVYRRLNRLVAAGFVTTDVHLDPDGHHCKSFRLARNAVSLTVEPDGITVTVRGTTE